MLKTNYYVSVTEKTITEAIDEVSAGLEIKATPEEIADLRELMISEQAADEATFPKFAIPKSEASNISYDQHLAEVYQCIYSLGTDKTKEQINAMHIVTLNTDA